MRKSSCCCAADALGVTPLAVEFTTLFGVVHLTDGC